MVPSLFNDAVNNCLKLISKGELKTFAPLVSLFSINGVQMSLHRHFQLLPMFNVRMPARSVYMIARQLGKSYQLITNALIRAMFIPFFHTLLIEPRGDQIKRMNSSVVQPMMSSLPNWKNFISNDELSRLALKRFKSGSIFYSESCYMSPDRVRGLSGGACTVIDETQDIDESCLPVIQETMAASMFWGFTMLAGTPKTTDTTLGIEWSRSSQAEWIIKCEHCGHFNNPHPEHDLTKMIGKWSDEYGTGLVCGHCGKYVYPINGGYVHAHPHLQFTYPGYHIPQVIHPMHCNLTQQKWDKLLTKVNTYSEMMLYNEVFGWPYDDSVVPLTLEQVINAGNGTRYTLETLPDSEELHRRYQYVVLGIDFDGGGAVSDSYTAVALCGLRRRSDVIDCIYARRYPKGRTASDVANDIGYLFRRTDPSVVAFDEGGAGFIYRQIMIQSGIPTEVLMGYKYTSPSAGDVIKFHKGDRDPNSRYFSIDKSRSLAVIIQSIKAGSVTVPTLDEKDSDDVVRDLLALIEVPSESRTGDTVYLIGRKSGKPDDFAHALNFACSNIWDKFHSYPKLGQRYNLESGDLGGIPADLQDDSRWSSPEDYGIFVNAVEHMRDQMPQVLDSPGFGYDEQQGAEEDGQFY